MSKFTNFSKFINLVIGIILTVSNVTSTGFPKGLLNDIVESNIVKQRLSSRWKWEVWDVVPGTHIFNVYLFNVTNPYDVERGGKPILMEIGPYAYTEHRQKFNVSLNLDLSVNYERDFTYIFDQSKSVGSESDLINIVNVPFIIFSTIVSRRGNVGNEAVNKLVSAGETLIKQRVTVAQAIFQGIDVSLYRPYLNLLDDHSSALLEEFTSGTYGVLKLKMGSHEGRFTVQSGLKSASELGKIIKLNNEPELGYWYGPTCNKLRGTDGTVFPPFVDKDTTLEVYDDDYCRSLPFNFVKTSRFHTIQVYGFALSKNFLADPRIDSSLSCFCKASSSPDSISANCLKAGVLDVSSCREGAPYVMSYPHFWNADPEYNKSVVGLMPNEVKHQTTIEVEPRIGVVTQYNRRLQWNIQIQPLPNIAYFSKFQPMIFPVLWNDDKFVLNDDKKDLLISELANLDGYSSSSLRNIVNIPVLVGVLLCVLWNTFF